MEGATHPPDGNHWNGKKHPRRRGSPRSLVTPQGSPVRLRSLSVGAVEDKGLLSSRALRLEAEEGIPNKTLDLKKPVFKGLKLSFNADRDKESSAVNPIGPQTLNGVASSHDHLGSNASRNASVVVQHACYNPFVSTSHQSSDHRSAIASSSAPIEFFSYIGRPVHKQIARVMEMDTTPPNSRSDPGTRSSPKERRGTVESLRKFSEGFVVPATVSSDILPILARDQSKREAIAQKAAEKAEGQKMPARFQKPARFAAPPQKWKESNPNNNFAEQIAGQMQNMGPEFAAMSIASANSSATNRNEIGTAYGAPPVQQPYYYPPPYGGQDGFGSLQMPLETTTSGSGNYQAAHLQYPPTYNIISHPADHYTVANAYMPPYANVQAPAVAPNFPHLPPDHPSLPYLTKTDPYPRKPIPASVMRDVSGTYATNPENTRRGNVIGLIHEMTSLLEDVYDRTRVVTIAEVISRLELLSQLLEDANIQD